MTIPVVDTTHAARRATVEALSEVDAIGAEALERASWPYPEYRDSSIEWLGRVPRHWQSNRLKYAASLINEKIDGNGGDLPYVGLEHIESWTGRRLDAERTESVGVANRFRPGDVLFGKLRPYLAKVHHARGEGVCTSEALVLRPRLVDPQFLFYYAIARAFIDVVDGSTFGSKMPRADWQFIGNLPCLIPPLPEQRAITAFLDRKTRQIDELIAKKRRLIELLHEKRTALISHVVTKGLNSDAPMKPFGGEWLGEVPEHWDVKRLKFISHLQTGLTLGKKHTNVERARLVLRPYLRVANVQDGWLDLGHITEVEVLPERIARYELRAGDVLMTEGGDFDKLGRGYVYEGQIEGCLHQNHIFAVRPDARKLDSRFLASMLSCQHGRNYFTKTSQQTTNLASTNATKLGDFPVPLPPVLEQKKIMARVAEIAAKLNALTASAETAIARLTEYRQALISSAVTGKIDVREEMVA